jgi:hypothetical protein
VALFVYIPPFLYIEKVMYKILHKNTV